MYKVEVDGTTDAFNGAFFAYFPNDVQLHAGDTVDFHSNFNGEPHTVTLGTDVDDVFGVIAQACPNGGLADPNCQEGPPEQFADQYNTANAKLPELLPDDPSQPVAQAAAQACYLPTGASAPTDNSACTDEQQTQPAFDGTQTFYNSGWVEDDATFTVELSDDIAAGTYYYYCLLHREGMSGTITVVDDGTDVPSVEDQTTTGNDQLNEMVTGLQPAFDDLSSLTADTALAGTGSDSVQEGSVNEFGPQDIQISTGGTVDWNIIGAHTVSFNAPESARPIVKKDADGNVQLNEEALTPQNSPGQEQPDPNAPPPTGPVTIDAGQWDGQGFHSSGIIFGPDPETHYKITFTTAGTYTYICLVHPDMEGTVTVSD